MNLNGVLAGLPGGYEWIIVLVIFLLLFGRRLPGVARSLGQGISSFKKGLNEPVDQDGDSGDAKSADSAKPADDAKSDGAAKDKSTSDA